MTGGTRTCEGPQSLLVIPACIQRPVLVELPMLTTHLEEGLYDLPMWQSKGCFATGAPHGNRHY